ncbi:UNVERIFIED_CONTAM: Proton pump-interactor 1 [Sesamum angustifolium]|uniref:Proton pump-interactor 1 n=1 Tax=Sesamum angustifolium TaxID=2727405 RepID=A0AAW2PBS6_9LAMI
MGVEIVDSNLPVIETGNEANVSVVNEKVNIKFGSHVVDEPVKGEANKVSESNLSKDAVDEWPEPKQIHSFYIVRYRALEDQKLKAKLDVAEKELQKKNQARSQIVEKIRAKRVSYGNFYFGMRGDIFFMFPHLKVVSSDFQSHSMTWKIYSELELLHC